MAVDGQIPRHGPGMDELRLHWCSPLGSGQKKATDKYRSGELDFNHTRVLPLIRAHERDARPAC